MVHVGISSTCSVLWSILAVIGVYAFVQLCWGLPQNLKFEPSTHCDG